MSLPLPEALFLLALHPDRGTILPSAYLALDVVLRGCLLAELKLTGHVQARLDGKVRLSPTRPDAPRHPLLRDTMDVLTQAPAATVREWYRLLDDRLVHLRPTLGALLEQHGIVRPQDRQRSSLPQQLTLPLADRSVREDMVSNLRASLDDGEDIAPRHGMLVALVVASRLESATFGELADVARRRAEWVHERDVITRSAAGLVSEAEVS